MRISFLALCSLAMAMAGCVKHSENQTLLLSSHLTGKWEYISSLMGTGGPAVWQPAMPGGQTIEFKPDGRFTPAASFSTSFRYYEVLDSNTLKLRPAPTPAGYVLMRYRIQSADSILLLNPIEPLCIDGCSYQFIKR